jgi:hypothetical protein
VVWGPRAGVGHSGAGSTYFGVWPNPGNKQKHKQWTTPEKVGVDEAPTEVSALPRVHLHLDPIFVGSHNSILGGRRNPL